jgi:capsular polysaccharide transport system permease protein
MYPLLIYSRTIVSAFGNWQSLIGLLMVQQMSWRFRTSFMGSFLTLAEPFVIVVGTILIRDLMTSSGANMNGYGQSATVFLSSGVFPFYLFMRLSIRVRVTTNVRNRLPRVTNIDLLISSMLADLAVFLPVMLAWFTLLYAVGYNEVIPYSAASIACSLFYLTIFGIGIGLINSALIKYFPIWSLLYSLKTRGIIFISGVFYILSYLPYSSRSFVVWNPVAHGVEWFRVGLYGPLYPTSVLDTDYLSLCSGISLFLGILAFRSTWNEN